MGLKWLANVGTTSPKDAADLVERMSKSAGMNQPWYDGFTCDEQFFSRPGLAHYTEALRLLDNPENRLIYTWIVGKPGLPGMHSDFISASVNASRGRGRLIFEAYCHSRPSEEDAVVAGSLLAAGGLVLHAAAVAGRPSAPPRAVLAALHGATLALVPSGRPERVPAGATGGVDLRYDPGLGFTPPDPAGLLRKGVGP